ncbi:glycosyltransferase family 2 protein [Caballeronia cordobensis]|uniref:glycosyltransferase family 2 protein n=1 Tax=Caballeronia cordobensis TaxID=1353886 RepID=UPI0005ED5421
MDAIVEARSRAGAVVVFYRPDAACFDRVNRLADLIFVVVVDNTPRDEEKDTASRAGSLDPRIEYRASGMNRGIAAAQNEGVDALISRGFDYGLLLDQDSEASEDLVVGLVGAMHELRKEGRRVALVGPAYDDPRLGGVTPFVRFGALGLTRVPIVGSEPLEVDFLISSGSCIALSEWHVVGPMDESLFIDFVDVEWCVRAKRAGCSVIGLPWLTMQHSLGDEPALVLGRTFAMHSAFRHYFLFRNATALIFYRRYMPLGWKISELGKLPVRAVIYPLFSGQPVEQIRMIVRGVVHGMINKLGPLRQKHGK